MYTLDIFCKGSITEGINKCAIFQNIAYESMLVIIHPQSKIIGANGSGFLKDCIDASYSVHTNIQVHTDGGISMGRGLPIVTLTNQNLRTHSSTESDIIVLHNRMPYVCWTRYFMEAQVYQFMVNIVY